MTIVDAPYQTIINRLMLHSCQLCDVAHDFRYDPRINANFQDTGLRGCCTCLHFLSLQSYQPSKQQCWDNIKFCSSYFSNLKPLDDGGESAFMLETIERYLGTKYINIFLYISIYLR